MDTIRSGLPLRVQAGERGRGAAANPQPALQQAEALCGLARYGEAADVAARALSRHPVGDVAARLRLARGHALWMAGRVGPARVEVARAADLAREPLTRARAHEALATFAWKERQLERAQGHLDAARQVYGACAHAPGLVRVLETQAGLLRDAGRLQDALRIQDLRVEIAAACPSLGVLARARTDRGALRAVLGRWADAETDISVAAALFRHVSDPREFTMAGLGRAALELARGDLDAARASIERARPPEGSGDPRGRGENLLLSSDLHLASGDAAAAERTALEALGIFVRLQDRLGESRSRIRRALALGSLRRLPDAIAQAQRALAPRLPRTDRDALAHLALGRALLGDSATGAKEEFEEALALSAQRPDFGVAARLGAALARGADREDPEMAAGLGALQAWGDRRLLACALAEVRRLQGRAPTWALSGPAGVSTEGGESGTTDERRNDVEPAAAPRRFPGIVGRSPALEALFEGMARVAGSEVPVHVCGETGTGKEKVARALHDRSARRRGPFVALNAACLSDELFQAELFGHARGAFTGAVAARDGLVAEARGGTLFLDEVAELSASSQGRLLRLLEEGEYRRVGENEVRRADVRVLTAANVELEEQVAAGRFRRDLLYRLNAVVLRVPPLRDRGEDVLLLARHFLRAVAAREGCAAPELSAEVAEAVLRHAWPGNVRELENAMAHAVLMSAGRPLRREHLPEGLAGGGGATGRSLEDALAACEREYIARALARHGGNRSRTAAELGLTRQGLGLKIRRLGL